jgi:hypothetical protein
MPREGRGAGRRGAMEMAVGLLLILISILLMAGITWEVSRNLPRG